MTEYTRVFGFGADVVSITCIVAPAPTPHGVPLEIPAGTPGTVVGVPIPGGESPYSVMFRIRNAMVEIPVSGEQIALDAQRAHGTVPSDMPPLLVKDPDRKRPYVPTVQYPHRHCRAGHRLIGLLMALIYGVALSFWTIPLVLVTILLALVVYGHQMARYREWTWMPIVFQFDGPDPSEMVVTDRRFMRAAAVTDALFAASLTAVVGYHFTVTVNITRASALAYVLLTSISLATGAVKLAVHDRAARIQPKHY